MESFESWYTRLMELNTEYYHHDQSMIDSNIDYFKDCHYRGLSPYKAFEFLYWHLKKLDKLTASAPVKPTE